MGVVVGDQAYTVTASNGTTLGYRICGSGSPTFRVTYTTAASASTTMSFTCSTSTAFQTVGFSLKKAP
jgi:hypothetical protein